MLSYTLPAAKFLVGIPPAAKTTEELFANKPVLVLAVPGAFTPTCSKQLPDYVKDAPKLKAKFNVTDMYCLTRNDSFVNDAWEKASNATGVVPLLCPTRSVTSLPRRSSRCRFPFLARTGMPALRPLWTTRRSRACGWSLMAKERPAADPTAS